MGVICGTRQAAQYQVKFQAVEHPLHPLFTEHLGSIPLGDMEDCTLLKGKGKEKETKPANRRDPWEVVIVMT